MTDLEAIKDRLAQSPTLLEYLHERDVTNLIAEVEYLRVQAAYYKRLYEIEKE